MWVQILYGNRSAAYHRLKKHAEALEDANFAVALDDSWVKVRHEAVYTSHLTGWSGLGRLAGQFRCPLFHGPSTDDCACAVQGHYRKACALASLERYREAAEAFERAFELCPTDDKLDEKAHEMRAKLMVTATPPRAVPAPAHSSFTDIAKVPTSGDANLPASIPAPAFASSSASFSGEIMEREIVERAPVASSSARASGAGAAPSRARFAGNNPKGDVVTFEPVGEAVRTVC